MPDFIEIRRICGKNIKATNKKDSAPMQCVIIFFSGARDDYQIHPIIIYG